MSERRAPYQAAPPREAAVVRAVLAYLNGLPGCHAVKRHGSAYGVAGEADVSGCLGGRLGGGRRLELEVKRPGREATPLQRERLQRWSAAGALVGVVHSVAEVRALIEEAAR